MPKEGKQCLWYVRRAGHVRGPYPTGSIRHYIVLGRVGEADELSTDRQHWSPAGEVAEFQVQAEGSPLAAQDRQHELLTRLRADERSGEDRRDSKEPVRPELLERRKSGERRREESPELVRGRAAKNDLIKLARSHKDNAFWYGSLSAAIVIAILGLGLSQPIRQTVASRACDALPRPGVDWSDCRLGGINVPGANLRGARLNSAHLSRAVLQGVQLADGDLAYADFSLADLSYAELTGSSLLGTTLRNADLTYASLAGADLSYANLTGARLGGANLAGAKFDHAIWVDQRVCAPGSVGRCN